MSERIHIQHYHSTTGGTPTADNLMMGEIAINTMDGNEQLFIKNTNNEVVTFKSYEAVEKIIVENELITASSLNDLKNNKQDNLSSGQNIKTINGQTLLGSGDINMLSCGTF